MNANSHLGNIPRLTTEASETNSQSASKALGKLFLVDQSDYNTLEIFFDAYPTDRVDIRDIVSGQRIPHAEAVDHFVVPCDKIDVLKDLDYFLKAIEACEVRMEDRIKLIEQGGASATTNQKDERDEWQELQECKDSEYLRRTVYPLLYPVGSDLSSGLASCRAGEDE